MWILCRIGRLRVAVAPKSNTWVWFVGIILRIFSGQPSLQVLRAETLVERFTARPMLLEIGSASFNIRSSACSLLFGRRLGWPDGRRKIVCSAQGVH